MQQGSCDFATGGVCPPAAYYAWSRTSQDYSSNVTGSSVFDFEADGSSEVIYADECFVRVYNGKTGEVSFPNTTLHALGMRTRSSPIPRETSAPIW